MQADLNNQQTINFQELPDNMLSEFLKLAGEEDQRRKDLVFRQEKEKIGEIAQYIKGLSNELQQVASNELSFLRSQSVSKPPVNPGPFGSFGQQNFPSPKPVENFPQNTGPFGLPNKNLSNNLFGSQIKTEN